MQFSDLVTITLDTFICYLILSQLKILTKALPVVVVDFKSLNNENNNTSRPECQVFIQ